MIPAGGSPPTTGGRGFSRWRFPMYPREISCTCAPDRLKPRPPVAGTTIKAPREVSPVRRIQAVRTGAVPLGPTIDVSK